MRRLFVVALAGCGFTPGVVSLATDAETPSGDGMIDAAMTANDAALDASPDAASNSARVRAVDIEDTMVTGGPHADFPVLVSINATWLRSKAMGGDVARADGFDIHFTQDQAGAVALAHEVELFDPSAGSLLAWVRVPSLSAATTIYVHYGDPALTTDPQNVAAVWSNGYKGVLHLDGIADATSNSAPTSATSGMIAGEIDRALTFDGVDDYIDIGSATAIDNVFASGGSAEAWFYAVDWGEATFGRVFDKGHISGWSLWMNNTDVAASISFLHGTSTGGWGWWNTPTNSVTLNAWHHVVVVYDKRSTANQPAIYLDGSAVPITVMNAPGNTLIDDSSQVLRSGNRGGLDRTFDGQLDELRVSSVTRDAGWVRTEYANQVAPGTFVIVGPAL